MKNKMKRIIAAVLSAVMCLALAACGGTPAQSGESQSQSQSGKQEENTPEFTYISEYKTLDLSGERSVNPKLFTNDGFYATSWEKTGEREHEGETAEYEGQFDIFGSRLYFVGFDGSVKELEDYVPAEIETDGEGKIDFSTGGDIMGVALAGDGSLVMIESVYANWRESEDIESDYGYVNDYYISHIDTNGKKLEGAWIEKRSEEEYFYTNTLILDDAGNALIPSEMTIRAIAMDGTTAYSIENDNYVDSLVQLADGRVACMAYGENGQELRVIDAAAGEFAESIKLPNDAYQIISGGGDYDLYYTSGASFYGYDIETETEEKIFNWLNCDVNGDMISGVNVRPDGTVMGMVYNYDEENSTSELVTIKKVPYDSVPHKETITMAVMYMEWSLWDRIINFNRSSDTCRIEILDYSEFNTEDDNSVGTQKLLTEIMSGTVPDILSLGSLPYTQLASKGVLEDLYPYIDADKDINRADLFENVLSALEVNGGLYSIGSAFYILSAMGAASVVGEEPGWSYDEFDAALASMPEGCDPFDQFTTRESILQTCLSHDMVNYVDWTTGQCSFDSESFVKLLEFAAMFPEEFDYDNYDWSTEDSMEDRIKQGKQMLMQVTLGSFDDVVYNTGYFGGEVTYIGYPTASGVGNSLTLNNSYAISSSCSNKQAAWEFLRSLLLEEDEYSWGFSLNKNIYNEKMKAAMTPEYIKDENGNIMLDENGEKLMQPKYWYYINEEDVPVYALTQEQVDSVSTLVSTTTTLTDYNDSIFKIVNEEAKAFFAGQKTAQDVAKLIQSKANIYVNEQR